MSSEFGTDEFLNDAAFGEPFSVDGSVIHQGSFRRDYVLINGVETHALILTASAAEMANEGVSIGTSLTKDGQDYVVVGQNLDSGGFVDLYLEEQ